VGGIRGREWTTGKILRDTRACLAAEVVNIFAKPQERLCT
jgi:hypothetical protein